MTSPDNLSWSVTYDGALPWTANADRTMHYHVHRKLVKEWRETFAWLALAAGLPKELEAASIDVYPFRKRKVGRPPDVAACYPAAKAALDGLVDYGLVADDDPAHVPEITFHAPDIGSFDGLRLVVTDLGPREGQRTLAEGTQR